jgi:hypothetical protein
MVLAEGHKHTMALDQSALLEALKAADVDDRIRQAAETVYQALIEAELSAVIEAAPHGRDGSAGLMGAGMPHGQAGPRGTGKSPACGAGGWRATVVSNW